MSLQMVNGHLNTCQCIVHVALWDLVVEDNPDTETTKISSEDQFH